MGFPDSVVANASMMRLAPALMVLTFGLAGCDLSPVCTTNIEPTFRITVVDSVSAENLAPAATVRVRDGTFVAELFPQAGVYEGPFDQERPGTYDVEVSHPDYDQWRREGVRVREGECHVITRHLSVGLVPDSL